VSGCAELNPTGEIVQKLHVDNIGTEQHRPKVDHNQLDDLEKWIVVCDAKGRSLSKDL